MLTLFMREVNFYKSESGKFPVADYLDSLANMFKRLPGFWN
ncbi:hypothetical protein ASZ90_003295 [hydrocarbon metagenome]|uniref:Uncharacterized protein n=1 Tax=hydrocarbon metagenome TaxID=938273 RepID=A0A0W8G126_9ZZZZ